MIKRIIFDIDNTLIPWENEYNKEINKALENLKITYTQEEIKQIQKAFDEYENVYLTFNKEKMIEFINQYTKKNYPKEFVYDVIERWGRCTPEKIDSGIIELLEYLKTKYELVILTDWYIKNQNARLEKLNILKYFQNTYGAETTKRKPFPEAFLQAIGNNKPEECIMIGDNIERDINGAIKAGLQAIYYNPKLETKDNEKYKCIKDLKQLKEIL